MMALIKEECEDVKIAEVFSLKQEDIDEQTERIALKDVKKEVHENEEKFQVERENHKTTYETTFKQQAPKTNQSAKRVFTCQTCGKSYGLQGNLKVHMRSHTGDTPFICPQCGKRFSRKEGLDRHVGSHGGEKRFTCAQCGDSFAQQGNLTVHMKIHTGEGHFSCKLCGKSFTHKETLNRHMRNHPGGDP